MEIQMSATAAQVRTFFQSSEARMASLSEAAQVSVRPGARGRLHPDAIKKFNSKRAQTKRYVSGATKAKVQAEREAAQALRQRAVDAGLQVGKRGPLPKATLQALKG